MKEAGFNIVRPEEFALSPLEPKAGLFDFDWLDHALQGLHEHGPVATAPCDVIILSAQD